MGKRVYFMNRSFSEGLSSIYMIAISAYIMIFTLNDKTNFPNSFLSAKPVNWHHYKAYHETSYLLMQFQSLGSYSEYRRPSAFKMSIHNFDYPYRILKVRDIE